MATYWRGFADGISDWTQVAVASGQTDPAWSVVSTDQLQATSASSHNEALVWDDIDADGDRDDFDILCQVYVDSTSATQRWLCGRVSTSGASRNGYALRVRTNSIDTYRFNGATFTQITAGTFSVTSGTWVWVRFRVNGSTIRARAWADGDSEPGTWQCDGTDSTYSTVGHVGALKGANTNTQLWRYFGVGTNGDTAPSSATSSGSAITAAAGAASASTLTGAATFAAGITSAAGSATASTISGSATFSASFTAADGAATAGTLTGGSTITAAAGASTAGVLAGSGVAASAITAAAGAATAGALAGASIAEAGFTPAAGESTAGTLVGVELSGSQIGIAAGSASASTLVGFSVAQAAFVAADGVGTGETLTYPDAPAEEAAKSGGAYLYSGFVKARKRLALQRLVKYLTQPEIDEETKRIIREVKQGKPIPEDAKPPVVMPEVSAEKLADKLIPARVAEVQALADVELQAVIRKAIRMAQERDDEDVLLLL